MADALQDPSASTPLSSSFLAPGWKEYERFRRRCIFVFASVVAVWVIAIVGVGLWLFYVQPMPIISHDLVPKVLFNGDKTSIPMPNGNLLGEVGTYTDELTAYLRFDYLKGIQIIAGSNVYIVTKEKKGSPQYTIYVQMPNDLMKVYHTLGALVIGGYIQSYDLKSPPSSQIQRWDKETKLFNAAYQQPVRERLLQLPRAALTSAVASFILFKIRTDDRVRERLEPAMGKELSTDDARSFAADMIDVAQFYKIPLDMLLGIGAMENNYLDIRGDLKHAVWKRHAQRGDIVLRRRRGWVLVSNYSLGPWQITRETLRYAHNLYLHDKKHDYSELPARLRPPRKLNFNHISTGVLTTYAGLLLSNLLDYFHGNVAKAEGAYNGGKGDPNLKYSAGVAMVANYARRVVGMAAGRKGNAVSETKLVMKKAPPSLLHAPPLPLIAPSTAGSPSAAPKAGKPTVPSPKTLGLKTAGH